MSERKVLNKYYPPDFDVKLIPKLPKDRSRQYVIRTMAPFNMQCDTCGEYIYKGKKFNARKETVHGEKYLGLEIYRFYIRCPRCVAEITFKTDLQSCDYAQEHGATRLFEAEKLVRQQEKKEAEEEEKDKTDAMKMLEKRTKMSRFEMEALSRLEELRELNTRQSKTDLVNKMLEKIRNENETQLKKQEEIDEDFVKAHFSDETGFKVKRLLDDDDEEEYGVKPSVSQFKFNVPYVKREIKDEPMEDADESFSQPTSSMPFNLKSVKKETLSESTKPSTSGVSSLVNRQKEILKGVVVKKQKKLDDSAVSKETVDEATSRPSEPPPTVANPLNLLAGYGSGDSDGSVSD